METTDPNNLYANMTSGSHSPTEVENGLLCKKELNDESEKHHEDTNSLSCNKKFKDTTRGVALNLKRKLCLEGSGLLRSRTKECDSGLREEPVEFPKADRPLLCSLASQKLKRIRDDEMVVITPSKRIQ
ncbi:hypothetical protein K7X08_004464 [Anisodus acutangulus]|uniref:Uncharacterized protein n=1 Tax=Anisodus acutangulus TaxID=402998 RepID=A0A9Q1RFK9_9SOLA|nr:hypothetical protein K7X08_004464 [Anisodus acutangulus]